jgi:hypothetical protein
LDLRLPNQAFVIFSIGLKKKYASVEGKSIKNDRQAGSGFVGVSASYAIPVGPLPVRTATCAIGYEDWIDGHGLKVPCLIKQNRNY